MLGKHYRLHEGIDLGNRIGDHASIFDAKCKSRILELRVRL